MQFPRFWSGGGNETVCGAGSMVQNMRPVIRWLPDIVRGRSVVELGCGDLNFARNAIFGTCGHYTGYDIERRASWGVRLPDDPFHVLHEANILDLREIAADVVVVRDVFIHLTNQQIHSILGSISCDLLISTTYIGANNRKRLIAPSAGFQALDLTESPFDLNCEMLIQEHAKNKFLGVFTKEPT